MRKWSRSRRSSAPMTAQLVLRGDEKLDLRRRDQHLADFVLEHPVLVGHAFAQMLELEPRFDQVAFLEPPELAHVLEDSPGKSAVAPALLAELVDRAQELRAILGIDAILDPHQHGTAIVRHRL